MGLLRFIGKLFGIEPSRPRPDAPSERAELIPSDALHRLRDEDVRVARRDGKVVYVVFPSGDRKRVEDVRPGRYGRGP